MSTDPKTFRATAAKHAGRALIVAAEIMDDPELSPSVRLEAGKWLTKVADLEPKPEPQGGGQPFSIVINFGDYVPRFSVKADIPVLDRLLGEE